ncbi:macrophage-stimulating protein receptor-like [Dermatophagoides farinae]|uniref:Macrophage-stimulating protein receptor-like n=1 Tax=Dermatophagoides farinae TaxID=6954 RepID=A0A9D4SC63_DERFA|nr:macrophage-stimulating protein receptor-like [Dermatophagoides farinae]
MLIQLYVLVKFMFMTVFATTNDSSQSSNEFWSIINHPCFDQKNAHDCQQWNYMNNSEQCMWCEYWCIHQLNASHDCEHYSYRLNYLFEKPKIMTIKPRAVFSDVPMMITISGQYLAQSDKFSSVYNDIDNIMFTSHNKTIDSPYHCKIDRKTFESIRCIIEHIDHTAKEIKLHLEYTKTVFQIKRSGIKFETNISLSVLPHHNFDSIDSTNIDSIAYEFKIVISIIGGMMLISSCWFLYSRRFYFQHHYEILKLKFYLQKMQQYLRQKNLYLEYESVEFKRKLGEGKFGEVYLARLTTIDQQQQKQQKNVAIKRLRKESSYFRMKMFITEGIQMSQYKHERILIPLAIFIDRTNNMPSIVMPLMINGNLCHFLQQRQLLPITELLKFSLQISDGMRYLSSKNFIHGDLAARNCLLDENFDIKIGDFGFSRQLYKKDYHIIDGTYRPIRWMSIECLQSKKSKFTKKSDIWSFGVVLWEIFTLGSYPYENLSDNDLCRDIMNGYRLPPPSSCPDVIYAVMIKCWSEDSTKRPNFECLCQEISQILAAIKRQQQVDEMENASVAGTDDQQPITVICKYNNYTSLAQRFIRPNNHLNNDDEDEDFFECSIDVDDNC